MEGETAIITVNVYGVNNTPLSTFVKILANNTLHEVIVNDGIGYLEIDGLEAGSYPIFALFEEDDNYNTAYNSTTFFIKYLTEINIFAEPVYDFGEIVIAFDLYDSHDAPVTGVVLVTVGGETYNVLIDNGFGDLVLNSLDDGVYTLVASYEGTNIYSPSINETTFKVKHETEFDVTIEGTYPDATITILGTNGKYNVTIVDEVYEVNVTRGTGILDINSGAGDYEAVVTYAEDNEYSQTTQIVPFTIQKAVPTIDTTITENIEVDQEGVRIHISVPEDLTGIIIVEVDGNPIVIGGYPVNASMDINVPSSLLTAGTHSYYLKYNGDNNYTAAEIYNAFTVSKITPDVIIYVEEDEIGVMGGLWSMSLLLVMQPVL